MSKFSIINFVKGLIISSQFEYETLNYWNRYHWSKTLTGCI